MSNVQSYPLQWPPGFQRARYRESGKFKTSYDVALGNVQRSLKLFASDSGKKLEHAIMSSNITLTNDRPTDPGVAVWFVWDAVQICIPVDRYDSPAKNLQAIHHIIEARRVELRHGTLALVHATFKGFTALPAPFRAGFEQAVAGGLETGRQLRERGFRRNGSVGEATSRRMQNSGWGAVRPRRADTN